MQAGLEESSWVPRSPSQLQQHPPSASALGLLDHCLQVLCSTILTWTQATTPCLSSYTSHVPAPAPTHCTLLPSPCYPLLLDAGPWTPFPPRSLSPLQAALPSEAQSQKVPGDCCWAWRTHLPPSYLPGRPWPMLPTDPNYRARSQRSVERRAVSHIGAALPRQLQAQPLPPSEQQRGRHAGRQTPNTETSPRPASPHPPPRPLLSAPSGPWTPK